MNFLRKFKYLICHYLIIHYVIIEIQSTMLDNTCEGLSCTNNWLDANGYDCDEYVKQQWCELGKGRYGKNWQFTYGTFEAHADSNGYSALQMCCQCMRQPSAEELVAEDFESTSWWYRMDCQKKLEFLI